ncbi:MAG: TonB-dependent receptor, partial [Desulfuromonadales bacterium]|nr:TonB-dependent receptor [Desulfuromonadales bacterium]
AITAGLRFNSSDDIHVLEPAFSLNGYQNATLPFAYFGEGIVTEVQPRDRPLDGEAITGTLGLGAKLSPELALFSYLNAFDADLDQSQALIFDRIQGHDRRLDFGFSIHFSPQNQLWLKAGAGDSESERKSRHNDFITDPACSPSADFMGSCRSDAEMDGYDIQYRQIVASDDRLEVSFGWEAASVDSSVQSDFSGATSSAGALSPDKTIMLRDDAEDRSQTVYLSAQYKLGAQLKAHAALDYSDYRKELVSGGYLQQGDLHVPLAAQSYSTKTNKLSPRFGLEYQHDDRLSARCAYQQWLRPASAHSLAPMATAGIALADELVLPGGEIERARLQIDWEFNDASYVNFFYDWSSTDNLSRGIGDVLNQRMELAELDRLRQQDYTNLPTLEQLEERPVFAKGEVDSVGVNFETILFDGLSLSAGYIYSEGENTGKGFSGLDLPYIPQHRALIGATWFPLERCRLQLQGVYRSSRPVDEPNTVMLDEDFTTTVTGQWQSNDKRYKLEAYAANLSTSQKDTLVGVNLLWRTDL